MWNKTPNLFDFGKKDENQKINENNEQKNEIKQPLFSNLSNIPINSAKDKSIISTNNKEQNDSKFFSLGTNQNEKNNNKKNDFSNKRRII